MNTPLPRIGIFGLGYAGSVTAACLAYQGYSIIGEDVNPSKAEMLASGRSPILEARMDELAANGSQAGRLQASTDAASAVCGSHISFVCVGTPNDPHGKLNLAHIGRVYRDIGQGLVRKSSCHMVVMRSTMHPGTTKPSVVPMLTPASGKRAGTDCAVCHNPELVREGTAVADFLEPAYTILGSDEPRTLTLLRKTYQGVSGRIFETVLATAETATYVSNAFHAVKVSFANAVGTLPKHQGVDTQEAMETFTSDLVLNISPDYLLPGFAFGGSCLPKDLRALAYRASELHLKLPLLESILPSNLEYIERSVEAVIRTKKKKIEMLGLSFKTGTDDLRDSPHVRLIKRLLGEGFQVQVWDPHVSLGRVMGSNRQLIEEVIPHIGSPLVASLEEAVNTAEVVVVGTREAQRSGLSSLLRLVQMVIDLANLDRARRPDGAVSYDGICWKPSVGRIQVRVQDDMKRQAASWWPLERKNSRKVAKHRQTKERHFLCESWRLAVFARCRMSLYSSFPVKN